MEEAGDNSTCEWLDRKRPLRGPEGMICGMVRLWSHSEKRRTIIIFALMYARVYMFVYVHI